MKSSSELINRLRRGFLGAAALTATLLFGSLAQAQLSPEGSWDCFVSGNEQKALAVINFTTTTDASGRFIFNIYQIQTPSPKHNSETSASRGSDGSSRSGSTGGDTNSASGETNVVVFGFFNTNGVWSFDNRGRIIGSYFEPTVGYAVSFLGTVVPGKRLTLKASTSNGKLIYQGKPFVDLGDFSGPWAGTKFQGQQTFLEFFNLTLSLPNLYTMDGSGPGYNYAGGISMISRHGKIGFVVREFAADGTNSVLRASIGPFTNNKNTTGGRTTGIIDETKSTPIRFNANLQTLIVP